MKVAVLGLGIEGNYALYSLMNHGHHVYASDLNENLEIIIDNYEDMYEIDLGHHDWDKINEADAIVLSPSLWNDAVLNKVKKNKIFSDISKKHREIFTIGVTGTNGKTTTVRMIQEIIENSGYKVLVGGNAGGGFEGYTKLMLEAAEDNYDYLVVEVCDMTLDFSAYNFDFDIIVATNLGYDHINVHGSLEAYQKKIMEFIRDKKAVLNINDEKLSALADYPGETHFFDTYPGEMKLIGNFNRQNAAAAAKVAEILNIPGNKIISSLATFEAAEGRITELKMGKTRIIIGKTDNLSAISAVIKELKFDAALLGTPRQNEYWRFDIFQEIANYNPPYIGLFPGLDNTTSEAKEVLIENNYSGPIQIFHKLDEIIEFLQTQHTKYRTIFIGGNGQSKIMEIKKRIENL